MIPNWNKNYGVIIFKLVLLYVFPYILFRWNKACRGCGVRIFQDSCFMINLIPMKFWRVPCIFESLLYQVFKKHKTWEQIFSALLFCFSKRITSSYFHLQFILMHPYCKHWHDKHSIITHLMHNCYHWVGPI